MRIKIFKKLFSAIAIVFATIAVAGCYDLGDFENEEAYYAAFGDVRLVYAAEEGIAYKDYPVEDYFYNEETVEDFTYGDPSEGKSIPQLPYTYMAVPIEQDISIDSLALYINATQTCALEIQVYLVGSLPNDGKFSEIKLLGDPEYYQKLDGQGNPMFDESGNPIYQELLDGENQPMYDENGEPIYKPIVYSDPDASCMVGKLTTHTQAGRWTSFTVNRWNNENALMVKKSQYLLLRFINNGGLATEKTPSVSFRTTNLLVRAFSED